MMKQKFLYFSILLCLGYLSSFAQNIPQQLTLYQLLDSALQNNYLLQATQKNTLIKESELELLKATYLPKIGTYSSFSYWDWLMPNKKKLLGGGHTDLYAEISAKQTLYDWGVNKTKKSVVEGTIALNAETERHIRQSIIWGVNHAYVELLKIKAQTEVYHNSLVQLNSQLKFIENLYKIGKASQVDLLRIKVKISTEEEQLQKSLNSEDTQTTILKNMCYLKATNSIEVDTNALLVAEKWVGSTLFVDTLYHQLLIQHPTIKASKIMIEQEKKQKELYRLENRPEIFSYAASTWEDRYIPFGNNFNYNLGLGIRYIIPYLGGKGFKTKMLQSDFRTAKLLDEKNQLEADLKNEIDLSLNQWKTLQDELESIKSIIELSDAALQNASVRYQSGQSSLIDVLDAQTILTNSIINYKKNMIALLQVIAKIHYLSGNDNYPFNF